MIGSIPCALINSSVCLDFEQRGLWYISTLLTISTQQIAIEGRIVPWNNFRAI